MLTSTNNKLTITHPNIANLKDKRIKMFKKCYAKRKQVEKRCYITYAKIKNFCSSKTPLKVNKLFASRRYFLNVYELVKKRQTTQWGERKWTDYFDRHDTKA